MNRPVNFLLLFLLLPFYSNLMAQGCGCLETLPYEQARDSANLIFQGRVIGIQTNPNKVGLLVTFQQDSSWLRPVEPFVTVFTEYETGCGYPFREGQKYLVFVNRGHSSLWTSVCQPNLPIAEAGELLTRLGPGIAPGRTPGTEYLNLILTLAILAGMFFLAFIVLFRRKKKAAAASR